MYFGKDGAIDYSTVDYLDFPPELKLMLTKYGNDWRFCPVRPDLKNGSCTCFGCMAHVCQHAGTISKLDRFDCIHIHIFDPVGLLRSPAQSFFSEDWYGFDWVYIGSSAMEHESTRNGFVTKVL